MACRVGCSRSLAVARICSAVTDQRHQDAMRSPAKADKTRSAARELYIPMGTMTERLERTRVVAATIEGWLTDAEGELLFRLADASPPGMCTVEIGSWKGKSTVWLASGLHPSDGMQVFAIDPHEKSLEDPNAATLDELNINLVRSGVSQAVVPIVAASHDAAQAFERKPGLVFVD